MVALKRYARIEANGLWRADATAQRRDVVVVLGDATLTFKSPTDQALTHWSLAAISRANPGKIPALYHPDGDADETLELSATEAEMIEAIEQVRRTIERARPKPGRLRWLLLGSTLAATLYGAIFWLPDALTDHTLRVVPEVGRADIGQALFEQMQRVTGPPCGTSASTNALDQLSTRLQLGPIAIMRGGVKGAVRLPGNLTLLSRELVEDHDEPDVAAGFALAAQADQTDPLRKVLEQSGLFATFRLLTTGQLSANTLNAYAEHVLQIKETPPDAAALIALFDQLGVRTTPYAKARDITGETTLALIENDPMRGMQVSPLLPDRDWLRLQSVCAS